MIYRWGTLRPSLTSMTPESISCLTISGDSSYLIPLFECIIVIPLRTPFIQFVPLENYQIQEEHSKTNSERCEHHTTPIILIIKDSVKDRSKPLGNQD